MPDDQLLLAERYRLGERIGRGGMAEVRKGFDLRLERWVAVKCLKVQLAADPAFQERFRREAHAVAHLNHPGIAAIYDTGEQLDAQSQVPVPFLVMELVDGPTLRDVLRDEGPLAPARALEVTRVVLRALSHSHTAGIIHRDIKPSNIMLTPKGDAKVMDFGIARAAAETTTGLTGTATVIGTAHYLSPEQARGERVDHRSDIYSTGCVLYELLLGRPPFEGDSPVSVAFQHVRETPVPPSQINPAIGPEVDRLIATAMAKDPADRYQSADEMADEIDDVLAELAGPEATAPRDRTVRTAAVPAVATSPGSPVDPEATRHLAGPAGRANTVATDLVPAGAVVGSSASAYADLPPAGPPPESEDRLTESIRMPGGRSLLVALVTLLLLAGLGFAAFRILTPGIPKAVSVPSLVGNTRPAAEQALVDVDLAAAFRHVRGPDDATRNTVVRQSPEADTEVVPGSTVNAEINVGPATTKIPDDLVGQSLDEVLTKLEDAGFVNVLSVPVTDAPKGFKPDQVTKVTPGEGQKAALEEDIVVHYVGRASRAPTAGPQNEPGGRGLGSTTPSPVASEVSASLAGEKSPGEEPSPTRAPSSDPTTKPPTSPPSSADPEPSSAPPSDPEPSEPEPSTPEPSPPDPSVDPSVEPSGDSSALPGGEDAGDDATASAGPAETKQTPPEAREPSGGPG